MMGTLVRTSLGLPLCNVKLQSLRHSGRAVAPCVRQLRVAVVAAGDELVASTDGNRVKRDALSGRKRRPYKGQEGRPRIPLAELSVGQKLQGTVRVVLNGAALLKTRAETDAYLSEYDTGDIEFSSLSRGMQLLCHITMVDPEKDILRVTLAKGGKRMGVSPRKDVQAGLKEGQVVEGRVKKVKQEKSADGWITTTGVFVDIGAKYDAFVEGSHTNLTVGRPLKVQIANGGLDTEQLKLRRRILAVIPDLSDSPTAAAVVSSEDDLLDDHDDEFYDRYAYLDDY